MALWSAFFPALAVFAPSCPIPLLESKVREAAIEFCQQTRIWTEWLDPVTSVAGAAEYDFDLPVGADVVRIERATVDGKSISVLSYRDAVYDWTRKDLTEQGLISRDRKTFRLGNAVAAGLLLQVQVALQPSRTSTGLPDDLYAYCADDIAHGARAAVLLIPETLFYKPDIAAIERAAFDAAIAAKTVQTWRGHTANTPRSRVTFC